MNNNFVSKELWEKGKIVLEEFYIEDLIDFDKFGKVYLVYDKKFNKRFVAKKIEKPKEGFLRELRDRQIIQENKYILPLKFFKIIGDEIIVFFDHIEGRSLLKWIEDKSLYEGDEDKVLERILDIIIQIGFGIEGIHKLGQIHQNIKPSNLIITKEGIAKLSDFCLEKYYSEKETIIKRVETYCSPEQYNNEILTNKTDIWSFGVTIIHIFNGKILWENGAVADEFLKRHKIKRMPEEIKNILLDKVLIKEPERRAKIEEINYEFIEIYEKIFGKYKRKKYMAETIGDDKINQQYPSQFYNTKWVKPSYYFNEIGIQIKEDEGLPQNFQASQDLKHYEELITRYSTSFKEQELAEIYNNKALVHNFLSDPKGIIEVYYKGIELLEKLVYEKGRRELEENLVHFYRNKGYALICLGKLEEAVLFFDKGIQIYEKFVYEKEKWRFLFELANLYQVKGFVLTELNKFNEAILFLDKAEAILEELVFDEGRWEFSNWLARLYFRKGNYYSKLEKFIMAIYYLDKAIEIREKLVFEEGKWDISEELAILYKNKGHMLAYLGKLEEAILFLDKAIKIIEKLVNNENKSEFLVKLEKMEIVKNFLLKILEAKNLTKK